MVREFMTLVSDEGEEVVYNVLGTIEDSQQFKGNNYVLLTPVSHKKDEKPKIMAYRFVNKDDGTTEFYKVLTLTEWEMIENSIKVMQYMLDKERGKKEHD